MIQVTKIGNCIPGQKTLLIGVFSTNTFLELRENNISVLQPNELDRIIDTARQTDVGYYVGSSPFVHSNCPFFLNVAVKKVPSGGIAGSDWTFVNEEEFLIVEL